MARRSFTVVDVTEILIHWYAGRSLSEVSESPRPFQDQMVRPRMVNGLPM